MNKNDTNEKNDQTDHLKQLFNEVNSNHANPLKASKDEEIKIDILNLPPRNEVHKNNKNGMRMTISKPFLRLSFVITVLIVLIVAIFAGDISLY